MDLTWLLNLWFSQPFLQLLTPTIQTIGFQNPLTLMIIAGYNAFSVTTLLILTVVAFPVLRQKTWILPLAVATTWIVACAWFFLNFQHKYGLALASATMLPHAWLEFAAIFLWVIKLKNACTRNQPPIDSGSPSVKTWLGSLKKPNQLITFFTADLEDTWMITKASFGSLISKQLKKDFTVVLMLIVLSAILETYVTPAIVTQFIVG